MGRAGSYNVIRDFQEGMPEPGKDRGDAVMDPYWIIAVYRLGQPLSFDRKLMSSGSKDLSEGALLRAQRPLVITDDAFRIQIANPKSSHTKSMHVSLHKSTVNYLFEVLPDDWVFCWMVNNRTDYFDVLDRVTKGDVNDPPNRFGDGLKFVGRVDDVYTDVVVEPNSGTKTGSYAMRCTAFRELDTQFFYDHSLASKDVLSQDIGMWLTRLGVNVEGIFGQDAARGIDQNNVNRIVPTLLNLILGEGPSDASDANIDVATPGGQNISATPTIQNQSRESKVKAAPYAYLVPISVASTLGVRGDPATPSVTGYAFILELLSGVQSYSARDGYQLFVPDLSPDSIGLRRETVQPMMGTFLPYMPDFANRPLWAVFQQYLNPAINEMYTCLRVNPEGRVMPTMVMRQIPFTTDAFVRPTDPLPDASDKLDAISGGSAEPPFLFESNKIGNFSTTKFLDLPRWVIPSTMVQHVHIGRSNATRTNFVHVYGQSSYLSAANVPIQAQMLENPPVRDDLDIMRSGLRPYMTTVECWVDDQVGRVPSQWIALIADWTIGSHLTFNGTIQSYGIQSPICEGDNLLFDGVVYHIQAVSHMAMMDTIGGKKQWMTSVEVCNGMRDVPDGVTPAYTDEDVSVGLVPIYPGFAEGDNTTHDPGLTAEHRRTTGGSVEPMWEGKKGVSDDRGPSPLNQNPSLPKGFV